MITNLQLLRAFAALAVVQYHTAFPLLKNNQTAFQGVAIFFVISGFIMTHIVLRDDKEASGISFILHRIIRIVPIYWFSISAFIMLSNLGLLNLPYTLPRVFNLAANDPASFLKWIASAFDTSYFTAASILKTYFFIPYFDINGNPQPILGVGWTLNIEMFFYVCFALALSFGKKIAPPLAALIVLAVSMLGQITINPSPAIRLYSSAYTPHFVAGIAVYYIWKALALLSEKSRKILFPILGTSGLILFMYVEVASPAKLLQTQLWLRLTMPAVLVFSMLLYHSCGWRIKNSFVLALGAASYALYLTHTIVFELLRQPAIYYKWLDFQSSIYGFLIAVCLAVVIALLVHYYVEVPALGFLRKKLISNKE